MDPVLLASRVLRPIDVVPAEPLRVSRLLLREVRSQGGVDEGKTRHRRDGGLPNVRREEPKPGGYEAVCRWTGAHRVEKEMYMSTGTSALAIGNRATGARPESLSGCTCISTLRGHSWGI